MLRVIRSRYGKEYMCMEFDYLGEHKKLDGIFLNADVHLYDNGVLIRTNLSNKHVFLSWNGIQKITYQTGKKERLLLDYPRGIITLEKVKNETDIEKFISLIGKVAPQISVIRTISDLTDEYNIPEEKMREFDEQDKRILKILEGMDIDDDIKVIEAWTKHLKKVLTFPFEAEIFEPQEGGQLKAGYILNVKEIEGFDDLCGVLVSCTYKNSKYSMPLCDLAVIDKDSVNFDPVNDYNMWFACR